MNQTQIRELLKQNAPSVYQRLHKLDIQDLPPIIDTSPKLTPEPDSAESFEEWIKEQEEKKI
jgi:hypothetical protein